MQNTDSVWLVERNFKGHDEGWWVDSWYVGPTAEAGARDHVRQIRSYAARNGYRLRARRDDGT